MSASTLSFRAAVCLGLIGMLAGIAMAASGDHSAMPAHAHLNLLGWVSLFLIGVFYRLHPSVDSSRLAVAQVWLWIVATVILSIGVAAIYLGHPELEWVATIGSLLIVLAMLVFAYLVFWPGPETTRLGVPAE